MPLAATLKVAEAPTATVWLTGWVPIDGGEFAVIEKILEVNRPSEPCRPTVNETIATPPGTVGVPHDNVANWIEPKITGFLV